MKLFTHILLPTDFSEAAARALDYATELANSFGARLTLFHATGSPASSFSGDAKGIGWSTDEVRAAMEKKMRDLLSAAQTRCPKAEAYVVEGDPWVEIPAFARKHDVDLIVLGTHGRRGLARALFGSVSEKVEHRTSIPVLTISGRIESESPTVTTSETSAAPR